MMSKQSAIKANHAIGAIVLAVFGSVWMAGWSLQNGLPAATLLAIGAVGLALCIAGTVQFRRNRVAYAAQAKTPAGKRAARWLGLVNAAQWVFIFAAVFALRESGQARWWVPTVIVIVGLHFLPLAPLLDFKPYYATAAALIVLAIAYPLIAPAGPESPVGLLGSGIVIWITAGALLKSCLEVSASTIA